jgi:hypothetical protein
MFAGIGKPWRSPVWMVEDSPYPLIGLAVEDRRPGRLAYDSTLILS